MPSWIDDLLQPGVLIPCAVILFILWLIVRSAFKAFPFVAKFVALVNTLVGTDEKPGIGVRMDVMTKELKGNTAKLGVMEEQMETVHHELTTNHGSSVKDATKRLEDQGAKTEKLLADHITETAHWTPMLSDLHQIWSNKPRNN